MTEEEAVIFKQYGERESEKESKSERERAREKERERERERERVYPPTYLCMLGTSFVRVYIICSCVHQINDLSNCAEETLALETYLYVCMYIHMYAFKMGGKVGSCI